VRLGARSGNDFGNRCKVLLISGMLKGEFNGWGPDKLFEFDVGALRKWRQHDGFRIDSHQYRPFAQVVEEKGRYFIEINGMVPNRVRVTSV